LYFISGISECSRMLKYNIMNSYILFGTHLVFNGLNNAKLAQTISGIAEMRKKRGNKKRGKEKKTGRKKS
jgi:hypothetical protein